MKKIATIIVLLSLSTLAFSQVKWGVDFSIGASRLRIDNPTTDPELFVSDRGSLGFNIGPFVNFGINNHWSIQLGVDASFNPSGLQFNGDTTFAISKNFSDRFERYNNVFLEVPLSVQYHLLDKDKLISPYLSLGAVFDFQILETCPNGIDECLDHTRDFNLGTIVGIGFQIKQKVSIGFKGEIGLFNVITDDYNISRDDLQINKDLLLVEIGYTFN